MSTSILKLREIIKETITPTISLHREASGTLDRYGDTEPSEEEINRLLFSNPYFDRSLCYYLMGEGMIGKIRTNLWVTEGWVREFQKRVEYWAESVAWLEGELILIHFPGFLGRAMVDDDQLKLPRLILEIRM